MEQVQAGGDGHSRFWCTECGGQQLFEQPPCLDGHGPDCPELACTSCGAAVLVGPMPQEQAGGVGQGTDSPAGPGPAPATHPQRYVA